MGISLFGWRSESKTGPPSKAELEAEGAPQINAEGLEAMHSAGGAYTDSQVAMEAAARAAGDAGSASSGALATEAAARISADAAHAALTTTAHGGLVASTDSRLTNARTPTAHATTHAPGGSDELTATDMPVDVAAVAQRFISVQAHGAIPGSDCTAAIKAAQEFALAQPGNVGVFFPGAVLTYGFNAGLVQEVQWLGVPRRSVLEQASVFTWSLGAAAIHNAGYGHRYNAATAGHVSISGIDFVFTNSETAEHTGIGLGNVASGAIYDCQLSTKGTGKLTLLDAFAAVRNMDIDVRAVNSTGAVHGGACWVRNVCEPESEAQALENATEHIRISQRSYFATNTQDEAISVFSSGGVVRHVHVDHATVEAPGGSQSHNHIASTFLLVGGGENPYARVEDVLWEGVTFIDVTGKIGSGHQVLVFGLQSDAGFTHTRLQGIRHEDCTFVVSSPTPVTVSLNIPNVSVGPSGNAAVNPTIIVAAGSEGAIEGLQGFPVVLTPTISGVTVGCRACGQVLAGNIEASGQKTVECGLVLTEAGDYQALAGVPEALISGAITRSSSGAATQANVEWPDGSTGVFKGKESAGFAGAIDSYTITRVVGATTHTYTQAAVTRDATGSVTSRPPITVS